VEKEIIIFYLKKSLNFLFFNAWYVELYLCIEELDQFSYGTHAA